MGYELSTGQKAQLLDQDGNGILEETVALSIADEAIVTLIAFDATTIGLRAGNAGSTDVTINAVTHTVTVTEVVTPPPAPFDWSLGDPVAA